MRRNLLGIGILAAFLLIAMPAMAYPAPTLFPLFADQDVQVGNVSAQNMGSILYLRYILDDGWYMNESHVANATSMAGLRQTKKGNPIPGMFPYSAVHQPPVNDYTYELPNPPSMTVYLAAQADVVHKTGDVYDAEAGAWAGTQQFSWKEWAYYFHYHKIS